MKIKLLLCALCLNFYFLAHSEASLIQYDVSSGGITEGDQFNGFLILNNETNITNIPSGLPQITYYVESFDLTINGSFFAGHSGYLTFEYYGDNQWGYDYYDPIALVDDTGGLIYSGSSTDHGPWTTQGPDPNNFVLPDIFGYWASTNFTNITDVVGYGRFVLSNPTSVPEPPSILLLGLGLLGFTVVRRKNTSFKLKTNI